MVVALNDGYAAARGRVLIRCDDDLTPGPDMIRRHLAHHAAGGQEVGVMGPTEDIFPDSPYAMAYGRPATERSLRAAYARPADQRWVGWAAHNSVTRSAWDRAGGFDPRFVYGQDSSSVSAWPGPASTSSSTRRSSSVTGAQRLTRRPAHRAPS